MLAKNVSIQNGVAYVGCYKKISAFDIERNRKLWSSLSAYGKVTSTPAIGNGMVFLWN